MTELLSPSPWRSRAVPAPASALTTVLLGVIVVTALYFGREVLVPIALAVLMSFVLAPLVRLLQGIYVPRIAAVIVSVLVAFALVFSLAAMMVSQVNQLASDLPGYQSTLQSKIQSLRGAAGGTGTLERASEVLKSLGRELDRPNLGAPMLSDNRPLANAPIPVEVRQPDPGALQTVVALITPLIHPLTTTGVVVIFVIFILLQRQDLRNRLIRLAGAQDLQRTTAAIDDAGQRLSRLFLTQLALNAAFGLVIGIGLWFIGVPSAPLWGMLAMILRFVPYIGAVIAAIFPLILAAAVDPGWTMVFWTAALFLTVEPIAGHAIEPLLYGHSTGLSPVAVITSATFWTWLWGPIGLILATPLTICLVVLGRHVDRLKFLDVMFGDRPPLSPPELVYQRMLAGDPMEAAEQAQEYLKDKPLIAYYEDVLVEGLKLAQADAQSGLLTEERMQRVRDAVAEIVDDLSTHEDRQEQPSPTLKPEDPNALTQIDQTEGARNQELPELLSEQWRTAKPVLCIPGLSVLDEAAALMIAQLVERAGIGARVESPDALSMSRIFSLDTKNVALVCLCYVENVTSAKVNYAIRRLRRKAPLAIILVASVGGSDSIFNNGERAGNVLVLDGTVVARTLRDAVENIVSIPKEAGNEAQRKAS
jgi:predicted PurR-regulated permease PerM